MNDCLTELIDDLSDIFEGHCTRCIAKALIAHMAHHVSMVASDANEVDVAIGLFSKEIRDLVREYRSQDDPVEGIMLQ